VPSLSTTAILLKGGVVTAANNLPDLSKFLNVYPSPAKDQLNVDIPSRMAEPTQIIIYDASGKQVKSFVETWDGRSPVKVDLSTLLEGNYILQVQNRRLTASKRFVVDRSF
jgi:hypothetical protein